MSVTPVEDSLELASSAGGDITGRVFERMFTRNPKLEEMFCLDRDGSVRGNMLAHAVRVLLDLVGERKFGHSFLSSEAIGHSNLGIDVEEFVLLYDDLRIVVRDLCGSRWSVDIEVSWHAILQEIRQICTVGVRGAGRE